MAEIFSEEYLDTLFTKLAEMQHPVEVRVAKDQTVYWKVSNDQLPEILPVEKTHLDGYTAGTFFFKAVDGEGVWIARAFEGLDNLGLPGGWYLVTTGERVYPTKSLAVRAAHTRCQRVINDLHVRTGHAMRYLKNLIDNYLSGGD